MWHRGTTPARPSRKVQLGLGPACVCGFKDDSMTGERVVRRLAAILAADVAGYSRFMGRDEHGTLAALKTVCQEVVDPAIASHGGRIVNTDDGLLFIGHT